MTRIEFLQQLRQALENDLKGSVVQENVDYYSQYIGEEINKGRGEAEVLEMLGDPWILARTVIDAQDGNEQSTGNQSTGSYGTHKEDKNLQKEKPCRTSILGLDIWWKKLLFILSIILVIVIIFSIVTGIISLLAKFLVPALIIIVVARLLGSRRS